MKTDVDLNAPEERKVKIPFVTNKLGLVIPLLMFNVEDEIDVPTAFVMFRFVVVIAVPLALVKEIDGLVMPEVNITLLLINVAAEIVVQFPLVNTMLFVVIADEDIFVNCAEGLVIPVFKTITFAPSAPVDKFVEIAFILLTVPAISKV
jgi:hypothetical protein